MYDTLADRKRFFDHVEKRIRYQNSLEQAVEAVIRLFRSEWAIGEKKVLLIVIHLPSNLLVTSQSPSPEEIPNGVEQDESFKCILHLISVSQCCQSTSVSSTWTGRTALVLASMDGGERIGPNHELEIALNMTKSACSTPRSFVCSSPISTMYVGLIVLGQVTRKYKIYKMREEHGGTNFSVWLHVTKGQLQHLDG
ncbi:hypothetical protein TCAL_16404 [Tigriopus californicus]|uniref:Uncharacterized protein n=1 Tax=Tigriopus californicus TaxID=6832 RepID=A0A553NYB8_TIGCA|nr:hypothetical protein TCAL_16404 [Tigriopus californicus]